MPTEIASAADLHTLVRADRSGDYIQTADIDLSGYANWEPIGAYWTDVFEGSYDGNGYKITNLTQDLTGTAYETEWGNTGIFGICQNITLQNIRLEDVDVKSPDSAVGALCGYAETSNLSNCSVVGGSVEGDGEVGGIVGYIEATGPASVSKCFSSVSVNANNSIAGGLIGYLYSRASQIIVVSDCYNMGDVSAVWDYAGGLVGMARPFGAGSTITIERCYSVGAVSGDLDLGGLLGYIMAGDGIVEVNDSYYNKGISGQTDTGKGEPRDTIEMVKPYNQNTTYIDWDFISVWHIVTDYNNSYPALIIPVESISVKPTTISIVEEESVNILAEVLPLQAINQRVIWSTNDYDVASVVGNGLQAVIYGNSAGAATITAKTVDGSFTATCTVTVTATKTVTAYSVLKILSPGLATLHTVSNTEIIDLNIKRELSGNHAIEFILPADGTAAPYIIDGRYVEAEGQTYRIERIRPVRGADGNPLLSVYCSHIFFEIENDIINNPEEFRGTILEHLNYVLQGTDIKVIGRASSSEIYAITRNIEYELGDSKLDGVKRIFNKFACDYIVNGFAIEVMPLEALTDSGASLEYAVNNKAIEKREDNTNVVTALYATGGERPYEIVGEGIGVGTGASDTFRLLSTPIVDDSELIYFDGTIQSTSAYTIDYETGEIVCDAGLGVVVTADYYTTRGATLSRVLYAPQSVRVLYRRDKIRFVNFGDILVWNNFVYVTDKYLADRQYPRVTYELDVVELKRLTPPVAAQTFDIGQSVTVKDTELGIEVLKPIQRYSYKPLVKESTSRVTVGDKPYDITFSEQRREGELESVAGQWRYDETTGQWIFFPDIPERIRPADHGFGRDFVLDITSNIDSGMPCRVRWETTEDVEEESRLTITEPANGNGYVSIVLDGVIYHTAVTAADNSRVAVATKIAAGTYPGWTLAHSGWEVVFTATSPGTKSRSAMILPSAVGVEGTFATNKGSLAGFISEWWLTEIPLRLRFSNGDEVQVEPLEDAEGWMKFDSWTGEGTGTITRTFTMDSDKDASANYEFDFGIEIDTEAETNPLATTVELNAEITALERYDTMDTGFVWAFSSGPTIDTRDVPGDYDGVLSTGAKGLNDPFTATLNKDAGGYERVQLRILEGSIAGGNVTVTLNGTAFVVAIDEELEPIEVASQLSLAVYTDWSVERYGTSVMFTATDAIGAKVGAHSFGGGTTGVEGEITTFAGWAAKPDDTVYYYRAFAKIYDMQLRRDVVIYGEEKEYVFEIFDYVVSISKNERKAIVTPFIGSKWFTHGDPITIQATPEVNAAYSFDKWLINDVAELTNPYTFNITATTEIKAVFGTMGHLTIGVSGGNAGVVLNYYDDTNKRWVRFDGGQLPFSKRMKYNVIKIVPYYTVGDNFIGWEGDGVDAPERARIVTMGSSAKNVTMILGTPEKRMALYGYISQDDPSDFYGNENDLWIKY